MTRRPASAYPAPEGAWVRYDGEGKPPVTDGPFAETKDLIAGWMIIDVDSYQRAVELAGVIRANRSTSDGGGAVSAGLATTPGEKPDTASAAAMPPGATTATTTAAGREILRCLPAMGLP